MPIVSQCLQLDISLPAVSAIMPQVALIASKAPVEVAPGTSPPFRKTQEPERGGVVPLDEFRNIKVYIWEIIHEFLALDGALWPIMSNTKTTTRAREIFQRFGESLRIFRYAARLREVNL